MSDESDAELPSNWQAGKTSDGRVFYIDHEVQKTQWEHPLANQVKGMPTDVTIDWKDKMENVDSTLLVNESSQVPTRVGPLPAVPENVSVQDSSTTYGHQSSALQILYGVDLTNRTAIVTGANTGIGFEIARSLAKHGCQVILACRNVSKGEAACAKIRLEKETVNVSCRQLDLCSLRSVKQFAEQYRQERLPLHLLILNAGVLHPQFRLTEDGYEEMFQVNYLSQAYLTAALLPAMLTTETHRPVRVIAVSCESHRVESPGISVHNGIIPERLSPRSAQYFDHLLAYGQSKLCLLMFIAQFRRTYTQIYSVACHPGNLISSNLMRHSYFYRLLTLLAQPYSKSMQQAAAPAIFCAVESCVLNESTIYYNNCFEGSPSSLVYHVKLIEDLWIETQLMIESAFKKQPLIV